MAAIAILVESSAQHMALLQHPLHAGDHGRRVQTEIIACGAGVRDVVIAQYDDPVVAHGATSRRTKP